MWVKKASHVAKVAIWELLPFQRDSCFSASSSGSSAGTWVLVFKKRGNAYLPTLKCSLLKKFNFAPLSHPRIIVQDPSPILSFLGCCPSPPSHHRSAVSKAQIFLYLPFKQELSMTPLVLMDKAPFTGQFNSSSVWCFPTHPALGSVIPSALQTLPTFYCSKFPQSICFSHLPSFAPAISFSSCLYHLSAWQPPTHSSRPSLNIICPMRPSLLFSAWTHDPCC